MIQTAMPPDWVVTLAALQTESAQNCKASCHLQGWPIKGQWTRPLSFDTATLFCVLCRRFELSWLVAGLVAQVAHAAPRDARKAD